MPGGAGYLPDYYNYKPSSRCDYVLGKEVTPLFAFGHGLSYTTFEYSNLRLSKTTIKKNVQVIVSVDIKNTGNRKGTEVVQLYITHDFSSVNLPGRELTNFKRIELEPWQTTTVDVLVNAESLSFYSEAMKWIAKPGDFSIMAGTASDNTQAVKLKVTE